MTLMYSYVMIKYCIFQYKVEEFDQNNNSVVKGIIRHTTTSDSAFSHQLSVTGRREVSEPPVHQSQFSSIQNSSRKMLITSTPPNKVKTVVKLLAIESGKHLRGHAFTICH